MKCLRLQRSIQKHSSSCCVASPTEHLIVVTFLILPYHACLLTEYRFVSLWHHWPEAIWFRWTTFHFEQRKEWFLNQMANYRISASVHVDAFSKSVKRSQWKGCLAEDTVKIAESKRNLAEASSLFIIKWRLQELACSHWLASITWIGSHVLLKWTNL